MEPVEYEALAENEMQFWWHRTLRDILWVELRKRVRVFPSSWIDVGCGIGGTLKVFLDKGMAGGIGCDFSGDAARFWIRCRPGPVCRADGNALPFRNGAADLTLNTDVICCAEIDPPRLLGELSRVLKKGGFLFLTTPAYQSLCSAHDRAVHCVRRFRRQALTAAIRQNGFEILRDTYLFPTLFPFLAVHRLLTKRKQVEKSEVRMPARFLNEALYWMLGWERLWLRCFNFAFGSTILIVARKV
mgnify:CR=1 FL=1